MAAAHSLSDTGERFIFDLHHDQLFAAEHLARYHWASMFVRGQRVADIACGSGYGSRLLMEAGARSVVGVDRAADAVEYARSRYRRDRALSFLIGDAASLPLADGSMDIIVSFETIEHLPEGERLVAEACRALSPTGTLLISSPNPWVYPEGNPFHISELSPVDFEKLLRQHFPSVALLYQVDWLSSSIMDDRILNNADSQRPLTGPVYKLSVSDAADCPYLIAACSRGASPTRSAQAVTVLIRDQQTQLAHMRRLTVANAEMIEGHRVSVEAVQTELAKRDEIIAHYQRHEAELTVSLQRLTADSGDFIKQHREAIASMQEEIVKRDQTVAYYQAQEVELRQQLASHSKQNGEFAEAIQRLIRTNADLIEHHRKAIESAETQLLLKDEALDEHARTQAAGLETQRELAAAATAGLTAHREMLEKLSAEIAARDAVIRQYQEQEASLADTQRQLANANMALTEQHREAVERGRAEAAKRDEIIEYYRRRETELTAKLLSTAGSNHPNSASWWSVVRNAVRHSLGGGPDRSA